jgi:hypothetical protein
LAFPVIFQPHPSIYCIADEQQRDKGAQRVTDHVSIIAPPLAQIDPATLSNYLVAADGWFPPIAQSRLRRSVAIDPTITPDRLHHAILTALETATLDLHDFRLAMLDLDYIDLATVPAPLLDGTSRLVRAWHRAIYALTKAEILETTRDYDATASGDRSLGAIDDTIVQLRRDATHALRDMKGITRTVAELI